MGAFDVLDLGVMLYREAWDLQKAHHARVAAGGRPALLLLEHPPVLTLGRKAREGSNIVVTREYLAAQGIEVLEVERGGDVTYHGPGQLVAYAIFPVGRRVADFLRLLEGATLHALTALGLPDARPNPGYAGVYVNPREVNGLSYEQKICSFGVAVQKNVALHGLGLNVTTNLQHFDLIVPCGLSGTHMTSVQREYQLRGIERTASIAEAKAALISAFHTTFAAYDWTLPDIPTASPTLNQPLQGANA
ncbi:lipoyl(octanoyl) transferase LipB [Deinococcus sp. Arct2-2]|uniref:lipoyl(octanoyl) transferase LipB n=1 Tax=Deinococcus sp. Arct2-2 TaxID=2568653 RepID=UPI0010A42692|nr:lipoyl(octanoyl) transferase LipB [Deinococcus sp. Arct2-2]THF71137.1 lipoyl(octanoyl) transferase LipB [Deinococcus sp. Arct2-2]